MPNNTTPRSRTRLRVVRSDGREWPTLAIAYRELLGTSHELGGSEHQRIRARIRQGEATLDRHGFMWRSLGGTVEQETIGWTDFTFGVEFEVVTTIDRGSLSELVRRVTGSSSWKVIGDASLISRYPYHGLEIVSPVLRGEEGLELVRKVAEMLKENNVRVNSSCGLHVHIGVRGMKASRLRKIARAFLNTEQHFDAIVPPSRQNNRYAQSNRELTSTRNLGVATTVRDIANAMNGGYESQHYTHYRYRKLNFQSFLRHGTIEFRQHAGTVEADKACNWVRLIAGFCAAAASRPEQDAGQVVAFEEFAAQSTTEAGQRFLQQRRAKFTRAQQAA